MNISSKRAEYIALTGLGLSLLFFIASLIIGSVSHSFAVKAISWQILGGALIWFVLVALFHQRSLAEREKLDMAQLSKSEQAGTIFQSDADRAAIFAVAGKRLEVLEKWFLPGFSVAIAIYQISIGSWLLTDLSRWADVKVVNPQLVAFFMAMIAFVSFLISRYATGMSATAKWRPLRSGGSTLLATAILSFGVAIALAFAHFKFTMGLNAFNWLVPALMVLLGIEVAFNVMMDFFRPRLKGQYARSAFDSRLLGIFNEPGGILHTFAAAIDYQFGFKVSQTWFYKVLEQAILPLIMFSALMLYLLSSVVVVGPGEQAVIERFGKFSKIQGPGLSFKMPSPFNKAYIHPTQQIQLITLGYSEEAQAQSKAEKNKPLLWGQKHYEEEYDILVAASDDGVSDEKGAPPVSIVQAIIPVQYRIKDLKAYLYSTSDSKKMLEIICYSQLTKYAASAKIETEGDEVDASAKQSLLGAGRKAASVELTKNVQAAVDEMNLGIEIVFLGLEGVHPPAEVAEAYQKVIGAVQSKQASILQAQAQKNSILGTLIGSVEKAEELYVLVDEYRQAKDSGDENKLAAVRKQMEKAFDESKGAIFETLSTAKSQAFEKAKLAEATGKRFASQVKANQAAPTIYKRQQRLIMLEEALADVRKYIVLASKDDEQIYTIDLQQKQAPDLYDLDMNELQ